MPLQGERDIATAQICLAKVTSTGSEMGMGDMNWICLQEAPMDNLPDPPLPRERDQPSFGDHLQLLIAPLEHAIPSIRSAFESTNPWERHFPMCVFLGGI